MSMAPSDLKKLVDTLTQNIEEIKRTNKTLLEPKPSNFNTPQSSYNDYHTI